MYGNYEDGYKWVDYMTNVPLIRRVLTKVLYGDGCWEWQSSFDRHGYARGNGVFRPDGIRICRACNRAKTQRYRDRKAVA